MSRFKKEGGINGIGNLPERYVFMCPGCEHLHVVYTKRDIGDNGPCWNFNGDLDQPTVTPSLLLFHNGFPKENIPPYRCHSFIKNGMIQFLGDCTHELKGKTVEIPHRY